MDTLSLVRRRMLLALLILVAVAARSHGGTFIGSESIDPDLVLHPTGYTGTGGALPVTVCIDPGSANADLMVIPVQNVVATWNTLAATTPNLLFGANNELPSNSFDFESAALHELGHCLGLGHVNLASESGLGDPNANYTKTTKGTNAAYDLDDGTDNVIGSSDDVRGDDVNLHWFRISNNNPFTIEPVTVDGTTYTRNVGSLPGGHLFVANAARTVGTLLGFADSEAVMQQGQFNDESQRQLGHDDVATLRLGMSGLDMTAGNADDYTLTLAYGGLATGCDINVAFDNAQAAFAVCQTSITSIAGTHWRISAANMYFNAGINWYFTGTPNSKCAASKLKAVGKKTNSKAVCYARAVFPKAAVSVDAACLAKAEAKFSSTFSKADAKGDNCLTTADHAAIEADVDAFIASLETELGGITPGPNSCTAAKYKAAGKKVASKFDCHGKAVMKGVPTDAACLAKAEAKFSSAFAKAETKVPPACLGGTNDAATVETMVDSLVDDVRDALIP